MDRLEQTICALATPPGEGGLAVIRVSLTRGCIFSSGNNSKVRVAFTVKGSFFFTINIPIILADTE